MTDFDVIVVGGGPGGYVAAVRASQMGLKTAVVEKEHIGGVCVNWGCIPTKALLRNAEVVHLASQGRTFGFDCQGLSVDYAVGQKRSRQVAVRQARRVEALLKSNKIEIIRGQARLVNVSEIELLETGQTLAAENIVLATGSKSRRIPGVDFDGQRVITYRQALELPRAPESALVIGAGPIGMEFATIWNRYGCKTTVVEMMPQALPLEDEDIGAEVARQFKRAGINILTSARVESVKPDADGVEVVIALGSGHETLTVETVLVAIGFVPNTAELGLEKLGVVTDRTGIVIDERMQTSIPGVYAIGDVTGKLGLAHTASAQGMIAAETIAGRDTRALNYANIPRCTYTFPETASVGLTEKQALEAGYEVASSQSPFVPNGKALAVGENIGFVKIVAEATGKKCLGVQMVGPHVTELIAGPTALIELGATVEQMARAIYPHPTLSEAVMEGLHALAGHSVHL